MLSLFYIKKMAPRGQYSERRIATISRNNSEVNWNGQTGGQEDGQDHVLSQADALTKNILENCIDVSVLDFTKKGGY